MSADSTNALSFEVIKNSYIETLKKYVVFTGRARRQEFWIFFFVNFAIGVLLGWIPVIGQLISLALMLPNLAVGIRRLHDTNRSAKWILLALIPGVMGLILLIATIAMAASYSFRGGGAIIALTVFTIILSLGVLAVFIYFWVQPGTPGENKYGPNPKDGAGVVTAGSSGGADKARFCGNCGAKNAAGTKFCGSCGKAL